MTILEYLQSRKLIIFLILLYSFTNLTVFFVYGSNLEPVLYAFVIYIVFLLIIGIIDYIKIYKKHILLSTYDTDTNNSLEKIMVSNEFLSTKSTINETILNDYQNIILSLEQLYKEQLSTHSKKEQELSDFYTLWVHQIKTPIAALRLIFQTSPDNISAMKTELFKIERYIDIILGYLRIDNLNQDLVLSHYLLEDIVKQVVKKNSVLFINSHLSLKLDNLSQTILTDEKWLLFAIEQLISNAIKYTLSGEIHIYANSYKKDNLNITELTIKDTGIGISSEDLPRIFDRSFTGFNGRADKKASGLGLYLCKTILTKLGHKISITSKIHEGTCVTVTFTENCSRKEID